MQWAPRRTRTSSDEDYNQDYTKVTSKSQWSDLVKIEGDKGGTSNLYNPENAWTDASGALHVQIKKKSGRWSCAEIFLNRSLGYGTAHSCELNV